MQLKNLKRGFTLIELLVVITIVGLIILTAFYTLGKSSQQVRLQMTAEQVASNLRFAQTEVKSGYLSGTMCRGYTFAEESSYTPVEAAFIGGQCDADNLTSSNVLFYDAGVDLIANTAGGEVTVMFEPPAGAVQFFDFNGDSLNEPEIELTFAYTLDDYPVDKYLTINKSGQISY